MPNLSFNLSEVESICRAMEQHKNENGKFSVTSDMLFNEDNYPDGIVLDENGNDANSDDGGWPDSSKMSLDPIPPRLMLVGDQGVYLMSNMVGKGSPANNGHISFAKGCDPKKDEDFYENKRFLFGGG